MALAVGDPSSFGEYRVVDRLGAGGMGSVFLARARSGREVAVKVVHEQYALDPAFRERFHQEVAAARKVSGAYTAPVLAADLEAPRPWMATQYVPGPTLSSLVSRYGPLDQGELRRLALGLVEALLDIHRAGVVHRDLKPANVLMAQDGPRVIDFGISRAADRHTLTVTGHVLGTPPFMSPEQFTDHHAVGPASDIFSLASLLAYAATGHAPFDADSPHVTAYRVVHEEADLTDLPSELRAVLRPCLAKNPLNRPGLEELARQFPELPLWPEAPGSRPGEQAKTPPVAIKDEPDVAGRKRPARPAALAVLAILALSGSVFAYYFNVPPGQEEEKGGQASAQGGRKSAPTGGEPAAWRPWQAKLPSGGMLPSHGKEPTDAIGCVVAGPSVFCGGPYRETSRIDAATGRTVWREPAPPSVFTVGMVNDSRPLGVSGGAVVVVEKMTADTTRLVALHVQDGRRLWEHPLGKEPGGRAVVAGEFVVHEDPGRGRMVVRHIATDKVKGSLPDPPGRICYPYTAGKHLYGYCVVQESPERNPDYVRYDVQKNTMAKIGTFPGNDEIAFLGEVDGKELLAMEVSVDGRRRPYGRLITFTSDLSAPPSSILLPSQPEGMPYLCGKAVCFVREDGVVTSVDALTGKHLWRTATGIKGLGRPLADPGGSVVFLPSSDGSVLALHSRTGKRSWKSPPLMQPVEQFGAPGEILYAGSKLVGTSAYGIVYSFDPAAPQRRR